jgi:hypothetical protein
MQFLPRQEEVPGWRLEADPLVYPQDQLIAYLAQDGKTFAAFQAVDVTVGRYERTDGAGFANVEIFRFPDFVKSFGAYSTQKNAIAQYLPLGNEAFAGKHSVHLWSGPFYVRLIVGGVPPMSAQAQRLASSVADRMPKAPGKPAVFNFLPTQFRVINSERHSAGPGLGQPTLANGFSAQYVVDGEPIDGIVVPMASRAAAAKAVNQFKQFFVMNGKLLDPIPNLGEDNFTAEDRYFGRTVVFRLDRFVFCFRGFRDRQKLIDLAISADQRILGTIRKQLQVADEVSSERAAGETTSTAPDWTTRR